MTDAVRPEERVAQVQDVMAGRIDESCLTCAHWKPCPVTPRTTSLVRYGDCARDYGPTTEEERCDMWRMFRAPKAPARGPA